MNTPLYVNKKGYPVTLHSHSAGEDFRKCRRLYKLKKVDGWTEKGEKASFKFGQCVEDAIQAFHRQCLPGSGQVAFIKGWETWKERELVYTAKEGDWVDLLVMGSQMLRLYEIMAPKWGLA